MLEEIGYGLNAGMSMNDIRFQNVFRALERYKEIYGDLVVPQPFTVPSDTDDWPEVTWGLRLGARVNAIRSQGTFLKGDPTRRQMLDDIGFAWSPPDGQIKRGRKSLKQLEEEAEAEEVKKSEGATAIVDSESESSEDAQDLNSLLTSFDFSGTTDSDGDKSSPTWGFEAGGGKMQEAIAAAQEQAAERASADEYRQRENLAESLGRAREQAIKVGIILEG